MPSGLSIEHHGEFVGMNLANECLFKRASLGSLVAMYTRIGERRLVPVAVLFLVTQELHSKYWVGRIWEEL